MSMWKKHLTHSSAISGCSSLLSTLNLKSQDTDIVHVIHR